jgi:phosphoglycolate phosphatase
MQPLLVFDLDGTLVDSVPDLAAALNRLAATQGLAGFDHAEVRGMIGDGIAALLRRALAARGRAEEPALLAGFAADYAAHCAELTRPYPGVPELLDTLQAQGWRVALCTNKPEAATRALLAALGLLHHFVAIGAGDTFPARKPDPAHLGATVAAAGGGPAIMVGDHHNDMAAAAGAGARSIWASWGYADADPGADAVAHAPGDIPGLAMAWQPPH